MQISMAETDSEIKLCYPILKQLRPAIDEHTLVSDVRRMQVNGYRLVYLADPEVKAVAGYRILEMFATGKNLYVDDLVTDSFCRSKGYGKTLLDWLISEAGRHSCKYLDLDSGSRRIDAHRFYRENGLEEVAIHFSIPANGGPRWREPDLTLDG